jgi:hypothetical protein
MDHEWWLDESFNNDYAQEKRQESALGKKLTPIEIDYRRKLCYIKDSGKVPYAVTLEKCTCSDYVRRKLTCKHMYRLAYELNLMQPKSEVKRQTVISIASGGGEDEFLNVETREITFHKNQDGYVNDIEEIDLDTLDFYYFNFDYTLVYYEDEDTYKADKKHFDVLLKKDWIVEKTSGSKADL